MPSAPVLVISKLDVLRPVTDKTAAVEPAVVSKLAGDEKLVPPSPLNFVTGVCEMGEVGEETVAGPPAAEAEPAAVAAPTVCKFDPSFDACKLVELEKLVWVRSVRESFTRSRMRRLSLARLVSMDCSMLKRQDDRTLLVSIWLLVLLMKELEAKFAFEDSSFKSSIWATLPKSFFS